jgi:predicted phosphoribosyltransferase
MRREAPKTRRRFQDRAEAGRLLAERLAGYAGRPDVMVFALPRGGVPVAFEIVRTLQVPLDVFFVRKLGVPGHEELAMGAIASGGLRVLNDEVIQALEIVPKVIEQVTTEERSELERRERTIRAGSVPLDPKGSTVILVDDGLATGSTMRSAVAALRREDVARLVVAVPVAAPETAGALRAQVDDLVCLLTPEPFLAVGCWYHDFRQITDEEVRGLLARAAELGSSR